ncbi:malate dehydrogenase [Kineosporia sp. A_224]|uniref:malate dehydrogenase n=1 Tax=Kineosporia sp. A_224 TaxID=1962180 RepID=UPI00350EA2FF
MERSVRIVVRGAATGAIPTGAGGNSAGVDRAGVDLAAGPPADLGPPSGALFRRGGPVPAVSAAAGVRTLSPASPGGPGRAARVVVVGAGHVGMIAALRLAEADVVDEVVLTDVVEGLAAGIALDLAHTSALSGFRTRLRGVGRVEDAGPADYYVLTAGRPRSPGMSRADLVTTNAAIVDTVSRAIARTSPAAVVVVVTNPLDEMTHQAWRSTGFPASRVLGMAGVLDTARFRALTAVAAGAAPDEVDAVALGSHGDEMVLPLSRAAVAGRPLQERLPASAVDGLVERARGSGAEIVALLGTGSAFMAPGTSAAAMVLAMVRDRGEVLPAAVLADGAYGLRDVYIGLPARLGRDGVREVVEVPLTAPERAALVDAAHRVRARVETLADVPPGTTATG